MLNELVIRAAAGIHVVIAGKRVSGNPVELVAEVQNLLPDLQKVVGDLELGPGIVDVAEVDDHVRLLVSNLPQHQPGRVLSGDLYPDQGRMGGKAPERRLENSWVSCCRRQIEQIVYIGRPKRGALRRGH